jgi:hypothetical protein
MRIIVPRRCLRRDHGERDENKEKFAKVSHQLFNRRKSLFVQIDAYQLAGG